MMRERIVYPIGESIAVLVPCECGLTVTQIAQKDVPAGVPFVIVDATDIPTDRTYRTAWRCDFSQPDGYGGDSDSPPPPEQNTGGLVLDPVLGWIRPEEVPEGRR